MNSEDYVVHPAGFTQNQLKEAFKRIENKDDWKLPIYAIIQTEDMLIVQAAVDHFAFGGAVFEHIIGNQTRVVIKAPGYYAMENAGPKTPGFNGVTLRMDDLLASAKTVI